MAAGDVGDVGGRNYGRNPASTHCPENQRVQPLPPIAASPGRGAVERGPAEKSLWPAVAPAVAVRMLL